MQIEYAIQRKNYVKDKLEKSCMGFRILTNLNSQRILASSKVIDFTCLSSTLRSGGNVNPEATLNFHVSQTISEK